MTTIILDATTRAAVRDAASQQAQLEALTAPWSAGQVTLRYYSAADALLVTCTHAAWAINTGTTPRQVAVGALVSESGRVAGPTAASYVIAAVPGGADILRADVTLAASVGTATGRPNLAPQTGGAGLVVRAGPVNIWPAWRRAMAANTWAEIPTTNTLSQLDPVALGLVPVGSNAFGNGTMTGNGYAWTGGVWDDEGQTFWIPTLGGHSDWGGNEPHKIDLSADTPTFVKLRLPSGAVGMPDVDRNAASPYSNKECVFEDGRIRPGHSYNNHVYVPGVGPIITRISGAFYDGTNSTAGVMHPGVRVARLIDSAGESSVFCDFNSVTDQGTGDVDDGAAEFDPTRGAAGTIWTVGSGTSRIVKIDVATRTATGYGSSDNWIPSGGNMKYVPGLDVLAFFDYGGALKILRIDTGATTPVTPAVSGSFSAGFGWSVFEGAGVDWSPKLGCFLLWNNATSRTEISTLTPSNPADPSAAWVRGTLTVSVANTVTPPAVGSAGATPFGRVRYSQKLGGLLIVGAMTQKPHFFATE